jgi:hypothetical protein
MAVTIGKIHRLEHAHGRAPATPNKSNADLNGGTMKTYKVYGMFEKGGITAVIVVAWNRADAIKKAKEQNPGFRPTGRVEEM